MAMTAVMTQCAATAILALDLGKFNRVACVFDPATGEHRNRGKKSVTLDSGLIFFR